MFSISKKTSAAVVLPELTEEQLSQVAGGYNKAAYNKKYEHTHKWHHHHHHHHHHYVNDHDADDMKKTVTQTTTTMVKTPTQSHW